jgi:hypothetical protein
MGVEVYLHSFFSCTKWSVVSLAARVLFQLGPLNRKFDGHKRRAGVFRKEKKYLFQGSNHHFSVVHPVTWSQCHLIYFGYPLYVMRCVLKMWSNHCKIGHVLLTKLWFCVVSFCVLFSARAKINFLYFGQIQKNDSAVVLRIRFMVCTLLYPALCGKVFRCYHITSSTIVNMYCSNSL